VRCWFERVRPAITDAVASTAAAEPFQKSDEIVGHASIVDKERQPPTFLHSRVPQKSAPPLTLC
jgi:hypothetical protein